MKISENKLRRLIRDLLYEQVVGYTAPSEKSSGDDGYIDAGDISEPLSDEDPASEKEDAGTQVRALTQQRQDTLSKGDTVTADSVGQQLALLRQQRG